MQTLRVKHMVCRHCIRVAKEELATIDGLKVVDVQLGIIELQEAVSPQTLEIIKTRLIKNGFELIDDYKSGLIEAIKTMVIQEIHHQADQKAESETYSDFIERKIGYEYSYLNELFSQTESKTIGQYIILQKVEKVKELLIYGEKSLNEIAFELEYSSSQYLSSQFKKFTGMTPTQFKKLGLKNRRGLDKL